MKHKHHIKPRYAGGTDEADNLVEVSVTQHAMWHYANWRLWSRKEDYLAWRGLAGFTGKEEIIAELMEEGRAKGRESNKETTRRLVAEGKFVFQQLEVQKKAIEASQKTQKRLISQGLHSLQNPEMRARRAEEDRVKRRKEFELGIAALQKPEVREKRRAACSKSKSSQNSNPVVCPHCGKTGGQTNMKRYHFDNCKLSDVRSLC